MKALIAKINELTGDSKRWGLYAACVPMQKEIAKLILAEQERIIGELERAAEWENITRNTQAEQAFDWAIKIVRGGQE